jgi:putative acetyltransferase
MSGAEPVCIALERPDQPEVRALIDALDAYQKPLYPPESHHGIDGAALRDPSLLFAVARDGDEVAVGCGAVLLRPDYAELKRMVTLPAHRGRGVGSAVLRFIEARARERGATRLTLETGTLQHEALRLYERAGYARCEAFGAYRPDPHSVFMTKAVAPAAAARTVSVWRARLPDVADVAPLFDEYRQFYGRSSDPALATDFLQQRLQRGESIVLIARDAGGVACGFAQLYPSFSSVRATRTLILNDLFVTPATRRGGAGRALLETAADVARGRGVTRLRLSTAIDNLPAQRLYESLGWMRDTGYFEYNLDVRPSEERS